MGAARYYTVGEVRCRVDGAGSGWSGRCGVVGLGGGHVYGSRVWHITMTVVWVAGSGVVAG